jgi:hypothetical protein
MGFSFARLSRLVSARGCSSGDDLRLALLLRDFHRHDLVVEAAGGLGRDGALLAAQGEGVLVGAGDLQFRRRVLRRVRHGVGAVELFHQRIDEAPADGGVENLRIAREGRIGLAHDEGRARHALDAAGDHQLGVAGADGARRAADGIHARAAQAVDRGAGHRRAAGRKEQGHARDVAVVLAGLVGAAVDDVVDALQSRFGWRCISALRGRAARSSARRGRQRAAVAADGGAHGVADEGFFQLNLLVFDQLARNAMGLAAEKCDVACRPDCGLRCRRCRCARRARAPPPMAVSTSPTWAGARILDRAAGGDGIVVVAVAGIGEGRIGQGEDEAAVAHAVAVYHVFGHASSSCGHSRGGSRPARCAGTARCGRAVHLATDGFGQFLGFSLWAVMNGVYFPVKAGGRFSMNASTPSR